MNSVGSQLAHIMRTVGSLNTNQQQGSSSESDSSRLANGLARVAQISNANSSQQSLQGFSHLISSLQNARSFSTPGGASSLIDSSLMDQLNESLSRADQGSDTSSDVDSDEAPDSG